MAPFDSGLANGIAVFDVGANFGLVRVREEKARLPRRFRPIHKIYVVFQFRTHIMRAHRRTAKIHVAIEETLTQLAVAIVRGAIFQ